MTVDPTVKPDGYAIPAEWRLEAEDRALIHGRTWELVLRGCDDAERYLELFEDELAAAKVPREEAAAFFASVIDLRRAQEASWDEIPTTNLTRAFRELETIGVIARQDFTCCGNCAAAEIGGERDESRTWRGYVYFHTQDTDQLLENHSTYVGYGFFPDSSYTEDAWFAMSEEDQETTYTALVTELMDTEVIPILTKHGIHVTWNRELRTRILLSDVDFFLPLTEG
ncbi:hypothetical protein J4H86_22305 [Spiractinospora alimapuensis]|uniref:DUF6891 domain-containing protein n=1 Tax=Spiractinospora alimapuensis TaxID=2820884 RepID=UPI001F315BD7|nr:hypothetical protein [Spiractinospora alimapuensis]QVQ51498.1 hypothetical protein J4H86_22305 [Spiractinospora alimapuensis]